MVFQMSLMRSSGFFLKGNVQKTAGDKSAWAGLSAQLNIKFFGYIIEKPLVKLRREEADRLK